MTRRLVGLIPVALLLSVLAGSAGPANGEAPSTLQVYDAQSGATPIGVVSKVPAETDGGFIVAQTQVELGKSRASAAAATLGPLGDAFVLTSVPVKGFAIPEQAFAQFPPSPIAPAQATASPNVNVGPVVASTFHAVADGSPQASADAVGGGGAVAGLLSIGGASSSSSSRVGADATVTTTAVSSVSDVAVGPAAAPLLTIASMTSTAIVKVPLGGVPSKSVVVSITGALVGGVPANITQSGVVLAGSLAVPATGVATINHALAQLSALGITFQSVPVLSQATASSASVSGAALEIGYVVPASLLPQLPTSIGTNETILLGQVFATATSRPRRPLDLGPPPASTPDLSGSIEPITTPDMTPSPASVPAPPAVVPTTAPPPTPAPTAGLFTLPRRTHNAAAAEFVLDYRIFIIAAIAIAVALQICRRTRLVD